MFCWFLFGLVLRQVLLGNSSDLSLIEISPLCLPGATIMPSSIFHSLACAPAAPGRKHLAHNIKLARWTELPSKGTAQFKTHSIPGIITDNE